MPIEVVEERGGKIEAISPPWRNYPPGTAFECRMVLWPEETGFSAHCVNLPGAISQGETEAEAIENMRDAFRETIRYYQESGQEIPFEDAEIERPSGTLERHIVVEI